MQLDPTVYMLLISAEKSRTDGASSLNYLSFLEASFAY